MYDDVFDKNKGYLGKLRSNFTGEKYVFYSAGDSPSSCNDPRFIREELGSMVYESNANNESKCPRKFKVILPILNEDKKRYQFKPKVDQ